MTSSLITDKDESDAVKKTVLIVIVGLSVLLAVGIILAKPWLIATSRCESGGYVMPPDALITVRQHEAGRKKQSLGLRPDDPDLLATDYAAIAGFLEDAYCDPVRLNLVSYAPGLVIETDRIRVNIHRETIIISVREDAAAVWEQGIRRRTSEDDRMVERLLELLETAER